MPTPLVAASHTLTVPVSSRHIHLGQSSLQASAFELQDASHLVPVIIPANPNSSEQTATANLSRISTQKLIHAPMLQLSQLARTAAIPLQPLVGDLVHQGAASRSMSVGHNLPDIAALTRTGYAPGYKTANQDACFVISPFLSSGDALLGVMDGHGLEGHSVSAIVKRNLPGAIYRSMQDAMQQEASLTRETARQASTGGSSKLNAYVRAASLPMRQGLERAFEQVESALSHSGVDAHNSGTTAVTVHADVSRGLLTTAWVGDSRAVLACRLVRRHADKVHEDGQSSLHAWSPKAWLNKLWGSTSTSTNNSTSTNSSSNSSSSSNNGNSNSTAVILANSVAGQAASSAQRDTLYAAWSLAVDLSRDHKPEDAREARRIRLSGGRVARASGPAGHPNGPFRVWLAESHAPGLAMSRALGDTIARPAGVIAVPEVSVVDIAGLAASSSFLPWPEASSPGASPLTASRQTGLHSSMGLEVLVLLASDGVFEFLSSHEAIMLAGRYDSANEGAKALIAEARR